MGALVFLEYEAPNPIVRQALLEQVEQLAAAYRGRLFLIGRERKADVSDREIMVVDVESANEASALAANCRAAPRFSRTVEARVLSREPMRPNEPLSPLFP